MEATAHAVPASSENEPSGVSSSGGSQAHLRAALRLDFQFDRSAGRTRLVASRQEPPLRVVRAFEQADGAALVHLHNVSGGLLGGDQLSLGVTAAPETCVQITTTGATRIYRPRAASPPAVQSTEITIGENALLNTFPMR